MTAFWFLAVLALVLAVVWFNLAKRPHPRAKLGPDSTNVREPETFVVHHEGKAQGIDIANTALKERTENVRRDLPGDGHEVKAKIPGRDLIRMDAPPSDESAYGDRKVAPGAEPKEKVLTEGPVGSRPGTPEEPGSPYAKGRRVTDNHRDVELAAELLPNAYPGMERQVSRDMAASPSTNGQEPGYGLGRTAPGKTDGEGGPGDDDEANTPYPTEQPDLNDDIPDIPEGDMPMVSGRGKVVPFRSRRVQPESAWDQEAAEELDWSRLNEPIPLPDRYGEDMVVAMVRNPRSLYVYWERNGHGDENLRAMLGDEAWPRTVPVLRIFDVTSGAYPGQTGGRSFVIEVHEHDDHWFINEGIEPGRRYVVSYERRTPDGQYYMLTHSNPVSTPADRPGDPSLLYQRYGRQPGEWSGSPWR